MRSFPGEVVRGLRETKADIMKQQSLALAEEDSDESDADFGDETSSSDDEDAAPSQANCWFRRFDLRVIFFMVGNRGRIIWLFKQKIQTRELLVAEIWTQCCPASQFQMFRRQFGVDLKSATHRPVCLDGWNPGSDFTCHVRLYHNRHVGRVEKKFIFRTPFQV